MPMPGGRQDLKEYWANEGLEGQYQFQRHVEADFQKWSVLEAESRLFFFMEIPHNAHSKRVSNEPVRFGSGQQGPAREKRLGN